MKENYLGVDVCSLTYDEITSSLFHKIENSQKSFIVAINPEKIMKAQTDENLRGLLNKADYQIPDGIGVILASKIRGGNIRERVTGIDMMITLCREAEKRGKSIFLYGAKPGIADQAKIQLEKQFPKLHIAGTMHGYEKDEEVVKKTINEANPDIIFVALGSPTQEYWIIRHMDKLAPKVYQGVGGSFDVISGNLKRAPLFFQRLGLEWFYRLIKEPSRWRRQLILPKFLIKALKEK
ncbi:N-acetylglucosaminyldiphosphoundecaprenol N-acetyl-beta-D-mannosaminyltransferase [Oikeobacillus pervagus]|uniref:N-acetylglucosaminyldiphosphoundecaprenol N-acetyl-beta-D-mannosaminyltransferase n=1 Tax=Oikeobacillus pervagus TaxID=1325931 RepID=A0AAJ1T2D8_9BACI|nr:WecB/TagA/CpsF family glycosyltransferase [Oikeobacillus pervagus]MDQ0215922.1 N-acetylglucosaminyldiphosphoundecaprenol N-acetyl-beta-D-mannosaminyltransferase [Oikeobacillus pervagus]